jgi:DNA adenine methylase
MSAQPLHRPFLKWAGNKYQIAQRIRAILPPGTRLIEPFVGSGAVFVNTEYPAYLLADANSDLIRLYQTLQREGETFIEHCRAYFTAANNTPETYYALRDRFNATDDPREKSALFLYLNRHCYNGLCRYNARGEFNVPFGRYKKPYFPEAEMRRFHERTSTATFRHANFVEVMESAVPGDVVYCDPPYVPLSATSNFTSYSAHPFGEVEQTLLTHMAEKLSRRGIPVVISNHDTELTRKLYAKARIESFEVQRYISCDGANRNKAAELLAIFS